MNRDGRERDESGLEAKGLSARKVLCLLMAVGGSL